MGVGVYGIFYEMGSRYKGGRVGLETGATIPLTNAALVPII